MGQQQTAEPAAARDQGEGPCPIKSPGPERRDLRVIDRLQIDETYYGDVFVEPAGLLILTLRASIHGKLCIAGRATVSGQIIGPISVLGGGILELPGEAFGDIHVHGLGVAQISGFVNGCLRGPGSWRVQLQPTAVVAEQRCTRWYG